MQINELMTVAGSIVSEETLLIVWAGRFSFRGDGAAWIGQRKCMGGNPVNENGVGEE